TSSELGAGYQVKTEALIRTRTLHDARAADVPWPFNQTRAKATSDCSAKAPTMIWSTESTVCDSARASATFCREETFITTAETGQQYYKACTHVYSIFPYHRTEGYYGDKCLTNSCILAGSSN